MFAISLSLYRARLYCLKHYIKQTNTTEEDMASYAMSTNYLRDNADQFSKEDMAALQAAMAGKDPDMHHHPAEGGRDYDNHYNKENREEGIGGIDGMIDDSRDMSYNALLNSS